MPVDWKDIEGDTKEKYSLYLCSREWCEKREKVRLRSGGKCERCGINPMDACHHLTYERKYHELASDLQAICNPCHDFTHGKSNVDPARPIVDLPFSIPVERGSDETKLLCPVCNYDYLHIQKAGAYKSGEKYISFHGECGHVFVIRFQEHKGNIFLRLVRDLEYERDLAEQNRAIAEDFARLRT